MTAAEGPAPRTWCWPMKYCFHFKQAAVCHNNPDGHQHTKYTRNNNNVNMWALQPHTIFSTLLWECSFAEEKTNLLWNEELTVGISFSLSILTQWQSYSVPCTFAHIHTCLHMCVNAAETFWGTTENLGQAVRRSSQRWGWLHTSAPRTPQSNIFYKQHQKDKRESSLYSFPSVSLQHYSLFTGFTLSFFHDDVKQLHSQEEEPTSGCLLEKEMNENSGHCSLHKSPGLKPSLYFNFLIRDELLN